MDRITNKRKQMWVLPSTRENALRLKASKPNKKLYEIIDEAVCEKAMKLEGFPEKEKKRLKDGSFFPRF